MNITRGKIECAKKVCLYGVEGIGKSTFAANFPDPIFIDTEGSTKEMDVARFDNPSSWEMLLQEVQYVIGHPNICKTLVIDTADWAEKLCIKSVCDKYQKAGIEAFDYGRGYTFVYESFGRLLNLLSEVVDCGIHVVLTAHAATKRREQPDEFGTYDCWGLKLIDSPKCSVANMLKEYVDLLLFVNYETLVVATNNKGTKFKASGGQRVMYTTHHPCWDAKNRFGLPDKLPFEFGQIAHCFAGTAPASVSLSPPVAQPAPVPEALPLSPAPEEHFTTENPDPIPRSLRDLMSENGVTEAQIQRAVARRGYYPEDTPIQNYDPAFVAGVLVGAWPQVYQMIKEDK